MAVGIHACGETVGIYSSQYYTRPIGDIAVFYGYDATLRRAMAEYIAAGLKVVYVDMGYWGRREGGRWTGYHKVSVNGRHPTAYFQAVKHPPDRFDHFGIAIEPWREGRHIVVAGMSSKGADAEGFTPSEWEQRTIGALRQVTKRPIIYRPKPSWAAAIHINGSTMVGSRTEIEELLVDCHAVVTHHSNVAIDALLAGVPAFTEAGVASVLCNFDLSSIDTPPRPDGREQFAFDLAYCQWTPAEMRSGQVWRHLEAEDLL